MMNKKIPTVKNPLTVIAIFAGTSEISGTAILPLLETESQQIYIWFLMLFPLILIIFFFITLNWNHKVLYSPSDFSNEDNFINILKRPSIQETISYIESNIVAGESNIESNTEESDNNSYTATDSNTDNNSINTSRAKGKNDYTAIRNINNERQQKAYEAELLVLNKLEKELGTQIQREMMIQAGTSKIIFDGVASKGDALIGIEVKYMRKKNDYNNSTWTMLINNYEQLFQSLSDKHKKSFSIILAIATDEPPELIKENVSIKMKRLSFPIDIRVYDFDELRNEINHIKN
jgi:hypothetical protein